MSTFYQHTGGATIKQLVEATGWKLGNVEKELTVDEAIQEQYFNITDGENFSWLDTNEDGMITGFTRYGSNDVNFIAEIIGGIDEYTLSEIYGAYEEVDDKGESTGEYDFDAANDAIADGDFDDLIYFGE